MTGNLEYYCESGDFNNATAGAQNNLTNHLTGLIVSKVLAILQQAQYRREQSFINQFINYNIHYTILILKGNILKGHICKKIILI